MSGALAERVFVEKMTKVGFTQIEVLDRGPVSIEDAELYPLFTPDLIALMRKLLTPTKQNELAVAVTVSAHKQR